MRSYSGEVKVHGDLGKLRRHGGVPDSSEVKIWCLRAGSVPNHYKVCSVSDGRTLAVLVLMKPLVEARRRMNTTAIIVAERAVLTWNAGRELTKVL